MKAIFSKKSDYLYATMLLACLIYLCVSFGGHVVALARMSADGPVYPFMLYGDPEAVISLKPAAERGDVEAQVKLGWKYFKYGASFPPYYAMAFSWYEKAAAQGSGDAQNFLGVMYNNGLGVQKDAEKSLHYYEMAASDEDSDLHSRVLALGNLAGIYQHGEGVPRDFVRARLYLEQAAAHNSRSAQARLGVLYLYGKGVDRDFHKAVAYFEQAKDNESKPGACLLGYMYLKGFGVERDEAKGRAILATVEEASPSMTPDQILRLARELDSGVQEEPKGRIH